MSEDSALVEELSRPGAAAFSAIDFELARRRRAATYVSLVKNQESPFHDLLKPAPYKVFYGGRGAAKDWAFSETLLERGLNEPDLLVLCTREYQNSIADSVHRLLRHQIMRLGLDHRYSITDRSIKSDIGAEFIFKGLHHNTAEIKSTEGIKVTWVAEAQNTTDDSWKDLLATVFRLPDSEVWVAFNVTDENSPTHKRMVTRPPKGAIVHKVNYTENPFFPKRLRELMEEDRERDPLVYQHVWLGMPRRFSNALVLGGRYLVREFSDDLHKLAQRPFLGADFGFANDPATLVRDFVLSAEICKKHGLILPGDPSPNAPRLFVEYEAGGIGIELEDLPEIYDSVPGSRKWPIKADNSRPEVISFLKGKGFNISAAQKWQGSVEDGIAHIRSHVVIIHPRCVRTEAECSIYSHKVDQRVIDPDTNAPQVLPIIIDAHNHYIDGIRYSLDGYIQNRGGLETWAKLAR